jgi:hypothetical protein
MNSVRAVGHINRTLTKAVILFSFAIAGGMQAQDVIMSSPSAPVLPPAMQEIDTNRTGVIQPGEAVLSASQTHPFQWGPLDLRPHFLYQFLYGNGIQASAGHPSTTAIYNVSPGLLLGLGSHWTVDYTPTWSFYSNQQFRNTFDQNVSANGGYAYGDWVLGLSQSYASTDQPLIETGGQTSQESYSTALTASYRFGRAMSVDLGVNQNFTFPDKFINSREWSTMDWLNYQFWPRLTAGIGVGGGYNDVSAGKNSVYEQYQGRIEWRATDKISLQIHGGVEDLQFLGGGTSDSINPVYGVSVQYQPFEATTISLSADGSVGTSYFTNQVTETTSVSVTLNQRVLKRLFLTVTGGYQNVTYSAAASGVSAGRNDDSYSFNTRLSTAFLKRGTIAATYQFSDNASNRAGFGYTSNQVGLEVGYRY